MVLDLVAGWPGLDKGTLCLVLHVCKKVCKKSVPFLRPGKIGNFRASNSRHLTTACPGHAVFGRVCSSSL